MVISVVIPTYKRERDLEECLDSILEQSFLPNEVFIIDNAKRIETGELVFAQKGAFNNKDVKLEYVQNKENSLTSAKNLGVKLCRGDIISFLDDDVVLNKDYFLEINKFFESRKDALGMCGKTIGELYEKNKLKFAFAQFLGKIFFLGFNERNGGRVLPSFGVTSPMGDEIVSSEWISGASSYRKKVADEFSFDENLKKYSCNEDIDFSHRVYKEYPGTLFFNPKVKYLHKLSLSGRTIGKERAFMEEVYTLHLFYKLIPQNLKNKLIYIWGRLGSIIYKLLKGRFLDVCFAILGMIFCLANLNNIKKGDLDFFNKTLK